MDIAVRKAWFRAGGFFALLSAAATGILTFSEQGLPEQTFWAEREWWIYAAVGLLVGVAVFDPGIRAAVQARAERDRQKAAGLDQVLRSALIDIHGEGPSVPWYEIGLHVWELRRRWWIWPRLEKRATLRISDSRRVGIVWKKGLGVVGRCWETELPAECNFSQLTEKYLKKNDAEGWEALPESDRLGMDWKHIQRAKRYGGVFAKPMYKGSNTFAGCVTLDGPPGSYAALSTNQVQTIMRDVARSCASVLYYATDQK